MCLSCVAGSNSFPPPIIDRRGYGFNVGRVHATSVPAQMINLQARSDLTNENFIGIAMRSHLNLAAIK